jgi:hypothetical protein
MRSSVKLEAQAGTKSGDRGTSATIAAFLPVRCTWLQNAIFVLARQPAAFFSHADHHLSISA